MSTARNCWKRYWQKDLGSRHSGSGGQSCKRPGWMRSWTPVQAPSPLSLAARAEAERWWQGTDRAHLTAPRAAIGALWKSAQAVTWPGPPPVIGDGADQR